MKDKNLFNKSVKDQFDQERINPPDFIWENVKTTLDNNRKKKIFPFWMIVSILAILALDFYIPQHDFSNMVNNVDRNSIESNSKLQSTANETPKMEVENNTGKSLKENVVITEYNLQNENVNSKNRHEFSNSNHFDKSNSIKINKSTHSEKSANLFIEKNEIKDLSESKIVVSENKSQNENSSTVEKQTEEVENDKLIASRLFFSEVEPLVSNELNLLNISDNQLNTEKCYKFDKKRKRSRFGLEVYGIGAINQQLLSAKNTDAQNYLNNRNFTEKNGFAYGGGAAIRYYFNPSLYLNAGLQYQERIVYFNYTNTDEVKVDSLGRIINGTRIKKTTNIIRQLELPILLGYQLNYGCFNLNFSGGVGIGLWNKRKGDIVDENIRPININSGTTIGDSLYSTKPSSSLILNASLEYIFTPKYNLFVRPTVQYLFKDISSSTNPLSERYLVYGLQAGVYIKL